MVLLRKQLCINNITNRLEITRDSAYEISIISEAFTKFAQAKFKNSLRRTRKRGNRCIRSQLRGRKLFFSESIKKMCNVGTSAMKSRETMWKMAFGIFNTTFPLKKIITALRI